MSSQDMNDVLLEENVNAGKKTKNKKQRGKAANPVQDAQDPDKMAEEFNKDITKEIDQVK
jgi:hypothetical protein